jgi:DNA-binding transcriptional LysR family regulator
VAGHTTVQNRPIGRRLESVYEPPPPLADLHILDLLELTGSQSKAAELLAMHQSTVSRSLQMMREQFRLQHPRRGLAGCRYGSNESLHLLRLSYRAHRLMGGLLRIATDVLHHPLLEGLANLQPVPPRWRSASAWAQLVSQALIDGAIVSSYCHGQASAQDVPSLLAGVVTVPLGVLRLQLVSPSRTTERVLLPSKDMAPRLHQEIASCGLKVEHQPVACQEMEAWLERLRVRQLAMPIGQGLHHSDWLKQQHLELLATQPPLLEQLWLLLPEGRLPRSRAAQDLINVLRERVGRASEHQGGEADGPAQKKP